MANFEWQKIEQSASSFSEYAKTEKKELNTSIPSSTILLDAKGKILYGSEYLNSLDPERIVIALQVQGDITEEEVMNYTYLQRFKEGKLSLEEIQNIPINYGNSDSEEEKA
jgi:hypothetical protein